MRFLLITRFMLKVCFENKGASLWDNTIGRQATRVNLESSSSSLPNIYKSSWATRFNEESLIKCKRRLNHGFHTQRYTE